jgi:hypothetical protein
MLPHCVWSLPPKGAAFCLGAARRQNRAPTLPHCVWSLPPKGALAPWGGPAALVGVSA